MMSTFDVERTQAAMFEHALILFRIARELTLSGRGFELPEFVEDFSLREPGEHHLPYEISSSATEFGEELAILGQELLKRSNLTLKAMHDEWERDPMSIRTKREDSVRSST